MKKTNRVIIYALIFVLTLQNLFFWTTFADEGEECYVCSRMSNEMQMYVNFQVEVISQLIQAQEQRDNYTWWTKKWLFSYGTVKVGANIWSSMKHTMQKTTQSSLDSVRSAEITSFILTKNATILSLWEWFGDMLVLFRQKPFMRDWSTLQEIDSSLDDLAWDVWMQWLLYKKISDDIVNWINDVTAKYTMDKSGDYQIFSSFKIQWNATYADVIMDLSILNLSMKNFFTTESIEVYKKRTERYTKDKGGKLWIKYSFNDKYLVNLSNSYACVKWKSGFKNCGWSMLDFASDIVNVWVEFKQSFQTSFKEIKEASINLAQATKSIWKVMKNKYSKNATELWLTDYQVELLSDVYGIDAYRLTQQQWFSLSTLFNWKFLKNLKNSITFSFDIFDSESSAQKKEAKKESSKSETLNWSKSTKKQKEKYCVKVSKLSSNADKQKCDEFFNMEKTLENSKISGKEMKKILSNDIDEYLEFYVPGGNVTAFTWLVAYLNYKIEDTLLELESDESIVMYSRNDSTTRYFVEIGANIHNMVENVIWSKDKWNSIVKNLWDACENQCVNKWWECFYQ